MTEETSSFYPPRARWYSPLLSLGDAFRRRLLPRWLRDSRGMTLSGLIGSVLIPGFGFLARDRRLYGPLALSASALLAISFFMWLGYPVTNWLFGLLLSLHACGIVFFFAPLLADELFRTRLLFTLCVLVVLGGGLYLPGERFLERHWFMPMRWREQQVVIVNRRAALEGVRRGDVIAYEIGDHVAQAPGVYLVSGLAIGPVLAVAGDTIRFSQTNYDAGGQSKPRLGHMPTEGEVVVPEESCFVWPDLNFTVRGQVGEAAVSASMVRVAIVKEDYYIGKPFKRWFWRRQL